MADTLGPVEVEFVIPADFGKQADAAIKKMAGLTDAARKAPGDVTDAFEFMKAVIKGMGDEIAKAEAKLNKMKPGAAYNEFAQQIGQAKGALDEANIMLQEQQIQTDRSTESNKRLSSQLSIVNDELGKMKGQEGTQAYTELEDVAGKLKNRISEVSAVTKVLGDDQKHIKGVVEGVSALSGAFAAGSGVVGLFAGENENLQAIMTKVQSAMSLTIGLQQVSNVLDKESYFMVVTVAKAKEMWITAEKALTAALWGSNIAAKALMGTVTLGLAVAIPWLISLYEELTKKQEEAAAKEKEITRAQVEARTEANKYTTELQLMMAKIKAFTGTKDEEKKVVDEVNKKYGETFGTYKTLAAWYDTLKTKAGAYAEVMLLTAESEQAMQNVLKYKNQVTIFQSTKPEDYTTGTEEFFGMVKDGRSTKQAGEDRKSLAIENATKWADQQLAAYADLQKKIAEKTKESGLNQFNPDKVVPDKPDNTAKEAKVEEEKTYYLDLLDEFKTYQEKREEIVQIYNAKIKKLEENNQAEKAQVAKEEKAAKLKALDESQPLAQLLEQYKTYDDQIKDIRTKSDAEILALKAKGYDQQAELAGQMAAKEIEVIETEKLKSLDAFKGLFEDAGSQTAEQIKAIIDEANQNLADLNPEELEIATEQIEKLGKKLDELGAKGEKKEITDPFLKLADAISKVNEASSETKKEAIQAALTAGSESAKVLLADLSGIVMIMADLGIVSREQAESAAATFEQIGGMVNGLEKMFTLNPVKFIEGVIEVVGNAIKLLDFKGKKIAKTQESVTEEIARMEKAYKALDKAIEDSLGEDKYALQTQQYKLNVDEMAKYQELIDLENKKKKKKRDEDAIQEWKDAIAELEGANVDIENAITESLAQTNARDFASQIGDSIVAAFDAGTDATIAWGEVTNQVMRNAVINALKLKYLEKPIQEAVDAIAAGLKDDSYLSADEVAAIRKIVDEPAALMNQALQTMPDLFGTDPASSADSPAKKATFTSMKEETGSALLGQFTALRMSNAIMADIAKEEQYVRKSMNQALQAIAENTSYCRKLENIDRTLKTIETDGIKVR